MITFQRKFSPNYKKTSLVIFAFFFVAMIIIGGLSNLIPMEVWNRTVNEALFGDDFKVYQLFPIGIIALFFIFSIWISNKSGFALPMTILMKEEKNEFQKRYNQDKSIPQSSHWKLNVIILVSIGFLYLLAWGAGQLDINIGGFGGSMFLFVFITGYVWCIARYMKGYRKSMEDIFVVLNTRLPKTRIQMTSENSPTASSKPISSKIEGVFKGREFELDYYSLNPKMISSYANARMRRSFVKTNADPLTYTIQFKLNDPTKLFFTIQEKNENWKKVEGANIDEAFQNRFLLKGHEVSHLPESFKRRLLEYQRNVGLELKGQKIIFQSVSSTIFPYYGPEGIILFLDFLLDLEKDLASIRS